MHSSKPTWNKSRRSCTIPVHKIKKIGLASFPCFMDGKDVESWRVVGGNPADEKAGLAIEGHDALARRRRLKRLVANLPGRSWIKLFYLLFVKGGILDGPAGWLYCRMQAHYEFMCTSILSDLRKCA